MFDFSLGIQTLYVTKDAERMQEFSIGDFTRDWVDFNCRPESEVYSQEFRTPIIVTYGISTYWATFRFHEPSVEEMNIQWQENFSIYGMKPFLKLYSSFDQKNVCCICSCIFKSMSLIKFWMWTPNQLDIGHGFRLVRFFKTPGSGGLL